MFLYHMPYRKALFLMVDAFFKLLMGYKSKLYQYFLIEKQSILNKFSVFEKNNYICAANRGCGGIGRRARLRI